MDGWRIKGEQREGGRARVRERQKKRKTKRERGQRNENRLEEATERD